MNYDLAAYLPVVVFGIMAAIGLVVVLVKLLVSVFKVLARG